MVKGELEWLTSLLLCATSGLTEAQPCRISSPQEIFQLQVFRRIGGSVAHSDKAVLGRGSGGLLSLKTHTCIDPYVSICRSNTSVPFLPGNSPAQFTPSNRAGVWGPLV